MLARFLNVDRRTVDREGIVMIRSRSLWEALASTLTPCSPRLLTKRSTRTSLLGVGRNIKFPFAALYFLVISRHALGYLFI
jgi:hypothetical protein